MDTALGALIWGGVGASSLLVGAVLALRTTPSNRTVGLVLAFGAGTLISAVAYELVPTETQQPIGDRPGDRPRRRSSSTSATASSSGWVASGARTSTRPPERPRPGPGRRSRWGRSSTGSRSRSSSASASRSAEPISVAFLVAVFISNLPEAHRRVRVPACRRTPVRWIYGMWAAIVVRVGDLGGRRLRARARIGDRRRARPGVRGRRPHHDGRGHDDPGGVRARWQRHGPGDGPGVRPRPPCSPAWSDTGWIDPGWQQVPCPRGAAGPRSRPGSGRCVPGAESVAAGSFSRLAAGRRRKPCVPVTESVAAGSFGGRHAGRRRKPCVPRDRPVPACQFGRLVRRSDGPPAAAPSPEGLIDGPAVKSDNLTRNSVTRPVGRSRRLQTVAVASTRRTGDRMTATREIVADQRDQFAFHDDIVYLQETKRGLTRATVEEISGFKGEPDWMLQYRLRAYEHFLKRPMPTWTDGLDKIDFEKIVYYRKPSEREEKSWDDVPDQIKATFEKLGIPEAERKFLAGVGAQYDSEVVYHSVKEELSKLGVVFMGTDQALIEYPEIFQPVLRDRRAGRGQQVLRPERGRLVGWLVRLCPQGRRGPAAAPGLLPDQRREHRPVRADVDRRRRGREGPLHRGLHRTDLRDRVAPRGGRRGRGAGAARRSATRRSRTGRTTSTTSSPSGRTPTRTAPSNGSTRTRARARPSSTRRSTCAARAPRPTSSASPSPARASTRTPVPRPSISPRTRARGSSRSRSARTAGGPPIAAT